MAISQALTAENTISFSPSSISARAAAPSREGSESAQSQQWVSIRTLKTRRSRGLKGSRNRLQSRFALVPAKDSSAWHLLHGYDSSYRLAGAGNDHLFASHDSDEQARQVRLCLVNVDLDHGRKID